MFSGFLFLECFEMIEDYIPEIISDPCTPKTWSTEIAYLGYLDSIDSVN